MNIQRRYIGFMEKTSKSIRLEYIDMTKGIGIILVILGHIIYTEKHILVWISSFHMPLFFVIAGIMMAIKNEEQIDIRKKVKALLIPYLWFSLIDFLLDIGNLVLGKIDKNIFVISSISSITFYGKSVMWFLIALLLAEVYFSLLHNYLPEKLVYILCALIAVISIFCKMGLQEIYELNADSLPLTSLVNFVRTFVRAGVVLPFVAYGYGIWKLLCAKFNNFANSDGFNLIQFISSVILLGLGVTVAMINWSVDTNNMVLGNPILYYAGGFLGSFGLVLLCKSIPSCRPITYFGRNSLIIMATHLECYILWAGIKTASLVFGIIPNAVLFVILIVVFTLIFECVPIEIINRFFPFIIGKKRVKSDINM